MMILDEVWNAENLNSLLEDIKSWLEDANCENVILERTVDGVHFVTALFKDYGDNCWYGCRIEKLEEDDYSVKIHNMG
jgi:hypothetical protein